MRKYLTYQNKGYFVSNVLLTSVQALTVIAVAPLLSFLIDRVNSQNMELKRNSLHVSDFHYNFWRYLFFHDNC